MATYDNSSDVLQYGQAACTTPATTENEDTVLMASQGAPSPADVASFAALVIDLLNPDLSPYLRQLGEDFIWGTYAHRVLQNFAVARDLQLSDNILQSLLLRPFVVADWSVPLICTALGRKTGWISGDGFVDLAKLDARNRSVEILELKPRSQESAGRAQIKQYDLAFGTRTIVPLHATAATFRLPSPFTVGVFTYTDAGDGLFLWDLNWREFSRVKKLVDEKVRNWQVDPQSLLALLALLALIAAVLALSGFPVPALIAAAAV